MVWGRWGRRERHPAATGATEAAPADVAGLQRASTRGVWALAAFTALSLWAHSGFLYFPSLPDNLRAWLGRPPPLPWIHGLFLLYLFSALILSLVRMAGDWHPFGGFRHLAYLAAFYGFYHLAGGLAENFWAVLLGGFSVLGLEGYRNWLQCRQRLREEGPGV